MFRLKPGLTPLRVLLFFAVIAVLVNLSRPQQEQIEPEIPEIVVEAMKVEKQDFRVRINSFGQVKPRLSSILMSEVSGLITSTSRNFRAGGFVTAGEPLVWIDARDYRLAVIRAEAQYAEARSQLALEQARVEQALADWRRLGKPLDQASDLVLRKPQLASARAQVQSAWANLEQARLELERTVIIAPYSGRVLSQFVDRGGAVSNNTRLAEVYATDYVEVRLPVRNADLPFAELPDDTEEGLQRQGSRVSFLSDLLGKQRREGYIVRAEGALDEKNRQLYVVAHIDNPYQLQRGDDQGYPLKIGQFVSAVIEGKLQRDALVVPNHTIYNGSYVYVVKQGLLYRQEVKILWQDREQALIGTGLEHGDLLVTTPLGNMISGTRVRVIIAPEGQTADGSASHERRG